MNAVGSSCRVRVPATPAMVMPASVRSPTLTANPAKGMIASLGTGMQALSRSIRRKTAGRPQLPMSSVAHWTTMSMIDCMRHRVPHAPRQRRAERRPSGVSQACSVARPGGLW